MDGDIPLLCRTLIGRCPWSINYPEDVADTVLHRERRVDHSTPSERSGVFFGG